MCYLQFKLFVFCGQTIIILNFVFIFTRFPLVSPNLLKCMLCCSSWQLFSLLVTSFFAASSKAKMSCHRGSDTMPTAILYSFHFLLQQQYCININFLKFFPPTFSHFFCIRHPSDSPIWRRQGARFEPGTDSSRPPRRPLHFFSETVRFHWGSDRTP